MMKTHSRLQTLLGLYLNNSATLVEKMELWDYINDPTYEEMVKSRIGDSFENPGDEPGLNAAQEDYILSEIFQQEKHKIIKPVAKLWFRRAAVAASIILMLGIGGYFYLKHQQKPIQNQFVQNDVQPGKNTATLTLANGTQIRLSDVHNGQIAKQAGVNISKTASGQLVYQIRTDQDEATVHGTNTLSTAKGETYQVLLPDGTKVWLNAATALTYPTRFSGNERRVMLSGEAYFEVKHNSKQPFRVVSVGQTVEDIGTHFNINTYEPEARTTLLEGLVKIIPLSALGRDVANDREGNTRTLKPGQQAILTNGQLHITETDTEDAVAWKNGYFIFTNEPLEAIMKRLSRWYNVEIDYQDEHVKKITFYGTVSRFANISKILSKLEATGNVHFEIKGRILKVFSHNN